MIRAVILALVLTIVPGTGLADIAGPSRVIDGDTIEVGGERIRLHGVDAPELGQTCSVEGRSWPCGEKAAEALAEKIGRSSVSCERRHVDRYCRIVASCTVDGDDLGAWLVRHGWAIAYRRYSLDYADHEDQARDAGAGLWAGTFIEPETWRREHRK